MRNDGASHSVLSILFSLTKADTSLSTDIKTKSAAFLDWIKTDLKGDKKTVSAKKSGVADPMSALLRAVDWNNRFSYFGSLTSPPCTTGVQWNILSTVLPVTKVQLDEIIAFTKTNTGGVAASTFYTAVNSVNGGNFREIQTMGGSTAYGGQKGYANAVYLTTKSADMLQLAMASTALLVAAAV